MRVVAQVMAQKIYAHGIEDKLARVMVDGVAQGGIYDAVKQAFSITFKSLFEYGLNYQNLTTFDKEILNSGLVKPGDAP